MKIASHSNSTFTQAAWLCMRHVGLAVLLMASGSVVSTAGAQSSDAAVVTKRQSESLRDRLAKLNSEISVLKQSPRSMSGDYRLRQKLADAEVLGRQLTDVEAKLRQTQPDPLIRSPQVTVGPLPTAQFTDGPAELAAKSDILLDQAQKLSMQADRIESNLKRERVRETLQARSRHLEQDPFTALEGAKRSLVFSRTDSKSTVKGNDDQGGPRTGVSNTESANAPMNELVGVASSPGSPAVNPPGATSPSLGTPRSPGPGDADFGAPTSSVSLTFRALLDAKALADVQRLEFSGDPNARAKAMSAAVAALRKQAHELETKAAALRGTK